MSGHNSWFQPKPISQLRVRVRSRIVAQPLLQIGERCRAGEVEVQRGEPELHHMTVRIDEAGQERPALAVDQSVVALHARVRGFDHGLDASIVVDQQGAEMLQLAVGPTWIPLTLLTRVSADAEEASSAAAMARRSASSRLLSIVRDAVKG